MYNTSNPGELYKNTTWELLPDNKFLKTGSSPLVQGGSNSISIAKANLPNIKLKTDTVSTTIGNHQHLSPVRANSDSGESNAFVNYGAKVGQGSARVFSASGNNYSSVNTYTSNAGAGNTGNISSSTETLGSGTAIAINPEHIVIKAWKRLT